MDITNLLTVDPEQGGFKIENLSEHINFEQNPSWGARLLGDSSLLLEPTSVALDKDHLLTKASGYVTLLFDLLRGLHQRAWDGKIHIELHDGEKNIYIRKGNIVFASSSYIEDRLGEVMYRHNSIGVEDYALISSLVSEENMFGKLLIEKGLVSGFEIWDSLRLQVKEIIRSIFLYEECSVVLYEGFYQTTEIVLQEPMPIFLDRLWGYYLKLKDFRSLLHPRSFVSPEQPHEDQEALLSHSYYKDILSMIGDKVTIEDFLKRSNQSETNSYHLLWLMKRSGLCKIEPFHLSTAHFEAAAHPTLKEAVSVYHRTVRILRQACINHNKVFPLEALREQMSQILDEKLPIFVLDHKGLISPYSLHCIYIDCTHSKAISDQYCLHLAQLSSILRMIGIDTLGPEMMGRIVESAEKNE